MEDFVYILDYLPTGRPDEPRRKDPVAYALGERNFVLLELAPKPGANMLVGDRVGVNKEPDSPVDHVRGRVRYEDITHAAQSELPFVAEQAVKAQEERFVKFYNDAGPVSLRMHQLELLPGLGKKLMMAVLDDKKRHGAFKSFRDIDTRVKALHQPEKLITNRIVGEIQNPGEKYHLFALPPAPEHEDFGRGPRGPPRGGPGMR